MKYDTIGKGLSTYIEKEIIPLKFGNDSEMKKQRRILWAISFLIAANPKYTLDMGSKMIGYDLSMILDDNGEINAELLRDMLIDNIKKEGNISIAGTVYSQDDIEKIYKYLENFQ